VAPSIVNFVLLQDPTGKINGYFHERVVNEYGPELGVGCVLLLSRVSSVVMPTTRASLKASTHYYWFYVIIPGGYLLLGSGHTTDT